METPYDMYLERKKTPVVCGEPFVFDIIEDHSWAKRPKGASALLKNTMPILDFEEWAALVKAAGGTEISLEREWDSEDIVSRLVFTAFKMVEETDDEYNSRMDGLNRLRQAHIEQEERKAKEQELSDYIAFQKLKEKFEGK